MLYGMSISELDNYKLISGHLDWSLLDCISQNAFIFTVLRQPVDRILSFYFYLRKKASEMDAASLELPSNAGMKAALKMPCDEYFASGPSKLRKFIDDHYDNFYMYYFAGRTYDARGKLHSTEEFSTKGYDWCLQNAISNLSKLNGVYDVSQLDALQKDIESRFEPVKLGKPLVTTRVNVGDEHSSQDRLLALEKIGATKITFDRIEAMTRWDNLLFDHIFKSRPQTL